MKELKVMNLWPRWDMMFPDVMQVVQYQQSAWKAFFVKKWFCLMMFGMICICFCNIVIAQCYFEYSNTFMFMQLKPLLLSGFVYVLYMFCNMVDVFYFYWHVSDMVFFLLFYFKDLCLNVFCQYNMFLLSQNFLSFLYYLVVVNLMSSVDFCFEDISLLNSDYMMSFKPYKLYVKEKQKLLFRSMSLLNSYNGFDRLSFFYLIFGDTIFYKMLSPIVYRMNVVFYSYRINFVFDNFMFYMFDILKDFSMTWFSVSLERALKGDLDDFGYNLLLLDSEYSFKLYKEWYLNNYLNFDENFWNNNYFKQVPFLIDGVYEKFLEANMISTVHFQTNTNLYGTNYVNMHYMLKLPSMYFYSVIDQFSYFLSFQFFFDIMVEVMYDFFEFCTGVYWNRYLFGSDICDLIDHFCYMIFFLMNIFICVSMYY